MGLRLRSRRAVIQSFLFLIRSATRITEFSWKNLRNSRSTMKSIALLLIGISLFHARPAAATSSSGHSQVRFRFNYEVTWFGDVDVELFDQEKPITVTNFLR